MHQMTISFYKKENLMIKLFRIFGVIGALICIVVSLINNVDYHVWILPIVYSIGMILLGNNNLVEFTPGIACLNVVMFCRYLILPVVMSFNKGEVSVFAVQYNKMNDALVVMLVELVGIQFSIYLTGIWFKKKCKKNSKVDPIHFAEIKYGGIICICVIAFVVVMTLRYPYLIGGIELLTQGHLTNTIDISNVSGMVGIVWKTLTTWIGIYILYLLHKKRFKGTMLTICLILGIGGMVLISFIGQTTISRWYSVVTFCAMYFSAIRIFPEKKRSITVWTVIPAFLLLLVVSVYKNTSYLKTNDSIFVFMKDLLDVSTLDAYFSGPVSVNNALYLNDKISFGITSIGYDLFRNFPILNHYINVKKATTEMYHMYLGRGDMILPLVGQSIIYFGYLFIPLLSMVSIIILRYFDLCYMKSNSMKIYAYSFTSAWMGLVTILNITICASWFYSIIIPIFLWIKFIEIIGTKKYIKTKINKRVR